MMKKSYSIYSKCVKEGTFLGTYYNTLKNINTPESFDFWQGMYALSTYLNRKVVISLNDKLYFPNLYCIFISDNLAMLEQANTNIENVNNAFEDGNNCCEYLNSYTSPTSFIEMMIDRSSKNLDNCISITSSSINTFFKSKDSIRFITDLYNCPVERRGYNGKNSYRFNNVYITLCCCCSGSDFFDNIKSELFNKEFLSKVITIAGNKAKTISEQEKIDKLQECIKELQERTKQPIFITFDTTAARLVKRLSRGSSKRYGDRPYELAVKLSGLLAINESSETITKEHVKNAYKLIETVNRQLNIFTTRREFEESNKVLNTAIKKILSIISASGSNGIGHFEVYQKVRYYISNEEFSQIMTILFEYNLITKYMHMNGKAIIYAPNENTADINTKDSIKIIKTLLNSD